MDLSQLMVMLTGLDPCAAVVGAVVLFFVQKVGGDRLPNLSNFLKNLFNKVPAPAPGPAPVVPGPVPTPGPDDDRPVLDFLMALLRARLKKRLAAGDDPFEVLAEVSKTAAVK